MEEVKKRDTQIHKRRSTKGEANRNMERDTREGKRRQTHTYIHTSVCTHTHVSE